MRLLRVISSMNPAHGGPCQGIRNSIPALKVLGVENEVVCLDDATASFLGNDDFTIHAIGPGKGPWKYNKRLKEWITNNAANFDAIIVHGLWLYHSWAVFSALKEHKSMKKENTPPFFVMPHGMLDPWFQKSPDRRLKAIRNLVYWKLCESRVVSGARGVLFTCEEELKLARLSFRPYKPQAELNISYGIKTPPSFNTEMNDAFLKLCPVDGRRYLLFLSRIHPKKGVDLLIRAYLKLEEKGYEMPALVIAGPGLDTSFGEQLLAAASLSNNIFFPGMLSGAAKWGAFYGCDAFILPSHQENFGIAVVEALACSKPVLISNSVNIWREIAAHNAGLIKDDTELGVGALLSDWLNLNADEKKSMSKNAKYAFENCFDVQNAAMRMAQVLKKEIRYE